MRKLLRYRTSFGQGAALVELCVTVPVFAVIIYAVIAGGFTLNQYMVVGTAATQAARAAAIAGQSLAPNADDLAINAITGTTGITSAAIQQIEIYQALPDGTRNGNNYDTYTLNGTTVITGAQNWTPDMRNNQDVGAPSDSVGIAITYSYTLPVANPFIQNISLKDVAIQRLNPPQGVAPCPFADPPQGIVATITGTNPTSNDYLVWLPSAGATSYIITASVNGLGFTNPVYSGPGTSDPQNPTYLQMTGSPIYTNPYAGAPLGPQFPLEYAPMQFEVSAVNTCGVGQVSQPGVDNQCPLPITPTAPMVTEVNGDTDNVSWDPATGAITYLITQTLLSDNSTITKPVAAPTTSTTFLNTNYKEVQYDIASQNNCGVVLQYVPTPPAMPVQVGCPNHDPPLAPIIQQIITSTAGVDKVKWQYQGGSQLASDWVIDQTIGGATTPMTEGAAAPLHFDAPNTANSPATYTVAGLDKDGAACLQGYGPPGPFSAPVSNGRP